MIQHPTYTTLLQFEQLNKHSALFNFSTTINGGVSSGNYQSFNLGIYSGDDIDNVAVNRKYLTQMLDVEEENLFFPYQTHGSEVCIIDEVFMSKTDIEKLMLLNGVDAVVTNQKKVCIGVGTADCVPILIYDSQKSVLAAIHAGWRGTVSKVVAQTVNVMIEKFDCNINNLHAGIGPCISQKHFEVGSEVVEAFSKAGFDLTEISSINKDTSKTHIDLKKANMQSLLNSGIDSSNIEVSKQCTYSMPELFFSARRQSIHSGRMITGGIIK